MRVVSKYESPRYPVTTEIQFSLISWEIRVCSGKVNHFRELIFKEMNA